MWEPVREKIEQLKQLDAQCQSFGAEHHRYGMGEPLSADDISAVENRLGCALPDELARFYREIGNGVVGPNYGTVPAASLFLEDARYIYVGEQGCGHQTFINASGQKTNMIAYYDLDEAAFFDTATSFLAYYEQWLDGELAAFREAKRLIDSGLSAGAIALALSQTHQRHDGRDLVASIINASKPVELIGKNGKRIYHGAKQNPWYETVLEKYRR
ncbi:MAG: SMI1/KNR4 family protein [Massilia sp.]